MAPVEIEVQCAPLQRPEKIEALLGSAEQYAEASVPVLESYVAAQVSGKTYDALSADERKKVDEQVRDKISRIPCFCAVLAAAAAHLDLVRWRGRRHRRRARPHGPRDPQQRNLLEACPTADAIFCSELWRLQCEHRRAIRIHRT